MFQEELCEEKKLKLRQRPEHNTRLFSLISMSHLSLMSNEKFRSPIVSSDG